jgi:adenylylsulfate kinase-like enzyme
METAKVIWVSGPSGGGKTLTGDYLELLHGYKHVDGDQCFVSAGIQR